jgi:hypothetical protein
MFDRVHLAALFYLENHSADFIKSLYLSDQESNLIVAEQMSGRPKNILVFYHSRADGFRCEAIHITFII